MIFLLDFLPPRSILPSMMIHTTSLAAKVAAVNRANAESARLHAALTPIFAPLVGCKILKADGTLLESVKKLLPEMPNTHALSTYREQRASSGYSLLWQVKAAEGYQRESERGTDRNTATYHETAVYIGELDGNVLTRLLPYDASLRRTDWTPEEVAQLRREAEEAKKAARDAEGKLHEFGLFDGR